MKGRLKTLPDAMREIGSNFFEAAAGLERCGEKFRQDMAKRKAQLQPVFDELNRIEATLANHAKR